MLPNQAIASTRICCEVANQDGINLLVAELEAAGKAAAAAAKAAAEFEGDFAARYWDGDEDLWMPWIDPLDSGSEAESATSTMQTSQHHVVHRQQVEQHTQAVAWLLQAAPAVATAAGTAEHLLGIPALPFSFALQLVTAGVRVSYSQLLAAASNMVAWVEVWALAQWEHGVHSDLPEKAMYVCFDTCRDPVSELLK
jgi:hypothetical protein